MITKSSGFSLVELLVVVAIIGVIASVGVISYSGYVRSSNMKAAENIMTQISLAQTEYYSDMGTYYETTGAASNSCTTSTATNTEINTNLFGGTNVVSTELGYNIRIEWNRIGKNRFRIRIRIRIGIGIRIRGE